MVGYALSTKGYRVWLPDENKIIETINVRFEKEVEPQSKRKGAVMGHHEKTDTESKEFLNDQEKHNEETPIRYEQIIDHPESSSEDETATIPKQVKTLREASWFRQVVPRKTGQKRNDIYYFELGKTIRLRSLNEVENYCKKNDIKFEPNLFSFSGKNTTEGLVIIPGGKNLCLTAKIESSDEESPNNQD